jgi:AGZA family xanthine/uracil permease-like MFS transporter
VIHAINCSVHHSLRSGRSRVRKKTNSDKPTIGIDFALTGQNGLSKLTALTFRKTYATTPFVTKSRYQWASLGDVNAFFGLMLDNVADLLLAVGLLATVFEFPTDFALSYMVPGTAVGVLVGDLLFFWMAFSLARRTGRTDITAMPLGLDTPSTFGMVFFVLGPSFLHAKFEFGLEPHAAAAYTWKIGICAIFVSGWFKLACSFCSHWVRTSLPRAGLLGSLAAIAIVLISFLPMLEIMHYPVVGMTALAVILTSLVAQVRVPFRIPGALAALLVGTSIYYFMDFNGWLGHPPEPGFDACMALFPTGWFSAFRLEWLTAFRDSLTYLPVVIPFALATVVGGIDCTESAAAVGDEFNTNHVIGVEALATIVAALCGGVIQTTPYIGHPAYKAMGGRALYTLLTALFVGGAGVIGYFGYLYLLIPKATVFPILVFVGLEITAQSFRATPQRHYAAVVFGCIPALAAMALIFVDDLQGQYAGAVAQVNQQIQQLEEIVASLPESDSKAQLQQTVTSLSEHGAALETKAGNPAINRIGEPVGVLGKNIQTMRALSGGFIVTSLLWASALAAIIDRRLGLAAGYLSVAAACSLFGVIHSPMPGSPLLLPWRLPENLPHHAEGQTPFYFAASYALAALLLVSWGLWRRTTSEFAVEPFGDGL